MLIKLPNARFINLDRVNMIDFEDFSETVRITWATGDAPTYLKGAEAIAFITAVEHSDVVDAMDFYMSAAELVAHAEDVFNDF